MNAADATAPDATPGRRGLDLAAGLAAWLIFAPVGAAVLLFYAGVASFLADAFPAPSDAAGDGPGENILLVVIALIIWFVGAWMTIDWWAAGRRRLWPLPLVLIPVFVLNPIGAVLFSERVRRNVLPRFPENRGKTHEVPRLLGVPRWALPLAVVFWLLAPFTLGLSLLLLFIRSVRRTVVPRRAR